MQSYAAHMARVPLLTSCLCQHVMHVVRSSTDRLKSMLHCLACPTPTGPHETQALQWQGMQHGCSAVLKILQLPTLLQLPVVDAARIQVRQLGLQSVQERGPVPRSQRRPQHLRTRVTPQEMPCRRTGISCTVPCPWQLFTWHGTHARGGHVMQAATHT